MALSAAHEALRSLTSGYPGRKATLTKTTPAPAARRLQHRGRALEDLLRPLDPGQDAVLKVEEDEGRGLGIEVEDEGGVHQDLHG